MVHISIVQAQLTKLGVRLSRWFQPELNELQHILMDDEEIIAAAPGRYFSGYALLVATNQRLLLIDKRTFFMTVEDTRYDMISEINFSTRIYDATVHIFTLNKQHNFTSIKYRRQLRELTAYVQQRVWEIRQQSERRYDTLPVQSVQPMYAQPQSQPFSYRQGLRIPKPHVPRRLGTAAMTGSQRYTPNIFTLPS